MADDIFKRASQMIEQVCREASFTPPQEDETIVDWADTAMDSKLAPRGAKHWREGRDLLLQAMQAALENQIDMCRALVVRADALVKDHNARSCQCGRETKKIRDSFAREFCAVCLLRRR